MKQKILEALKQGYKNLGLSEEAFERVATLGETFIKEESEIANFVKGAEAILKGQQSEADKARGKAAEEKKALEDKIAELEAKLNGGGGNPEPPKPDPQPQDFAKIIAEAVASAVKPLQEEITQFKGEQAAKKAFTDAELAWKNDDYVKKYNDEAQDAWERAVEINELTGNKMTAQELTDKAKGYFTKLVSRKGVDITKPFQSEGSGDGDPDFSHFDRAAEQLGLNVNN